MTVKHTPAVWELIHALEACEHALGCLLQTLDPQEIRDSFQTQAKALEKAQTALAKARMRTIL
jgi:hypothetical protein